jgi:aspartyl-tRNA(Asn)/glutamyl-tRNA(Gln) amidotransferase subunit B
MTKSSSEEAAIARDVRDKYETVIGLEVHVQLLTETKIFCGCANRFGDAPNTNVCPVCLGLPGTLPILNKRAVELAMRAADALDFRDINPRSRFARKNYFYPDLPKGYQISQYELPLATHGGLAVEVDGEKHWIGITRLHLEEDAAKNLHEGFSESATKAYIDFNRCGTPLCEIVSEPAMRTAEQAHSYLMTLAQRMLFAGVSDCDMEEGSLRCDANVSVRLHGEKEFGTKVEVKNLNSFRFVKKAIEYEIDRQITILESGGSVSQETRLWNQEESRTASMRSKEKAHDYRYFPEPDLLPVHVSDAWREEVLRSLPELPEPKRARFVAAYGITPYDAGVLTTTPLMADYFEAAVNAGGTGKAVANWIQTELLRRLNDSGKEIEASPVSPAALAELLKLIESGKITGSVGKKVFAIMFETGKDPAFVVSSLGLGLISGSDKVREFLAPVLTAHPERLNQFRQGKVSVTKSLMGDAMKLAQGRIKAQEVQQELDRVLLFSPGLSTSTNTAAIVVSLDGAPGILSLAWAQGSPVDPLPTGVTGKLFSLHNEVGYPELWLVQHQAVVASSTVARPETKTTESAASESKELGEKEE